MPTNDFLTFGQALNANVMDQPTYAALTARTTGFQSGVAQSQQVNKVLRQSSFMAAMLASFCVDHSGLSLLDNGDIPGAEAVMLAALNQVITLAVTAGAYATAAALTAEITARQNGDASEGAIRSSGLANEAGIRAAADTAEAAARFAADAAEVLTRQAATMAVDQARIADLNYANATFARYSNFAGYANANGWITQPGGTLFQWGNASTVSGYLDTFLFPTTFPNSCWQVFACEHHASGWNPTPSPTWIGTDTLTNASFKVSSVRLFSGNPVPAYAPGISVTFFAVGN